VLAVTFTNKACDEMRERLIAQLGNKGGRINVSTFHGFCFEIIREQIPSITAIVDERLRMQHLFLLFPGLKHEEAARLSSLVTLYFESPDKRSSIPADSLIRIKTYLDAIKSFGGVDLSTLITGTNQLLKKDKEFLDKVRRKYRYIAIDELQDINAGQYTLITLLFPAAEKNEGGHENRGLCAIGDPDQSIYGFRGSDLSLFFDFKNVYSPAEISLTLNYRSAEQILKAGEAVISHNSRRKYVPLTAVRGQGNLIRYFGGQTSADEGKFIANTIEELIGGMSFTAGSLSAGTGGNQYSFSDIAVLARTRAVFDGLLPFLIGSGIPAGMRSETPVFSEPPFSHVLSLLSYLVQENDHAALYDILITFAGSFSSNSARTAIAFLKEHHTGIISCIKELSSNHQISSEQFCTASAFFSSIPELKGSLEQDGVQGLLKRVFETYVKTEDDSDEQTGLKKETLLELAGLCGKDLAGFIRKSVLGLNESEGRIPTHKVQLLTFHAAKGLEFPVVFIAGAEEGITPLLRTGRVPHPVETELEEERRLFYVALTRAKDLAIITSSAERRVYGTLKKTEPSRFISEIPPDLIQAGKEKQEEYGQALLF
jgi:DNA helicase-2/ATP-dependent DNA helicase PcrA